MPDHQLDGKQIPITCNCGRCFVVEFWVDQENPIRRRSHLIDVATSGEPTDCPSCGVSLAITLNAWQHRADEENAKL